MSSEGVSVPPISHSTPDECPVCEYIVFLLACYTVSVVYIHSVSIYMMIIIQYIGFKVVLIFSSIHFVFSTIT